MNFSAAFAMDRGHRPYRWPVVGSTTSQMSDSVVCAKKGSISAVSQSGSKVMSDSLIAFQPAMEEPSNIVPSDRNSSSTSDRS